MARRGAAQLKAAGGACEPLRMGQLRMPLQDACATDRGMCVWWCTPCKELTALVGPQKSSQEPFEREFRT
jgi:hypothetical protein